MIQQKNSLRLRIFSSMMVLLLLSFLLTGTITFYHFKKENEQYHFERLKRKEYAVNAAVDYFIRKEEAFPVQDSLVSLFSDKICELADIHKLEVNIYSLSGHLLISSDPELVRNFQLPDTLSEVILQQVGENQGSYLLSSTNEEGAAYLSSFDYITNERGHPVALISLPYFPEEVDPIGALRLFLTTLSEIYLILLALAALAAYILSRYIAGSLSEVARKLRSTRLSGKNTPLSWSRDDEIGALIQEYNRMLEALEQSAVELARNERDHAWRDMARQVAHEIKNPLTPMRLQLQQLERRSSATEPAELQEITRSMVEQIDNLTEIASAFSRFASLPDMKAERVDLLHVLRGSVQLFQAQGVTLSCEEEALWVHADPAQWNRAFNNLLQNAVQAIPGDRKPEITVKAWAEGENVQISICDNGIGMEDEQKERLFEPRFTTKSKGMGLGLAMVKRIVEQSAAEIRFDSRLEEGTCFNITLLKN